MFSAVAPILALMAAVCYVCAAPNPTGPGPGDIFVQGGPCTISWDVDQTGVWKHMNIQLMTGDNLNMVPLATVARGLDGTNPRKRTFSYTCPQVSPHSPIYFYQFSTPSTSDKTWTGRFTITDSAGNIETPSKSKQPSGEDIPWGVGSLVGGWSGAVPPSSSGGGGGTGLGTRTSSAPPIPTSGLPAPPSVYPSKTAIPQSSGTYATSDALATSSSTSASIVEDTNGAVPVTLSSSSTVFRIGLGLGLAVAFGFTVVF